jgi:hypothetical protein
VFVPATGAGSPPRQAPATTARPSTAPSTTAPAGAAGRLATTRPATSSAAPARSESLAPVADQRTDRQRWLLLLAAGLVVLALALTAALAVRRRRPQYGPEHRA